MAPSPEHDYIGSAKISSSFESSSDYLVDGNGVNLRETELRLGLPGSGSPKRQDKLGMAFGLQQPKSFAFGSKRGFSDAIHGNVELDFPGCGGSNVENEKGGILFSLRRVGSGGGAGMHSVGVGNDVSGKAIPLPEKKTQGSVKAQAVGWPPIRSYRKNTLAAIPSKNIDEKDGGCLYVKVSMDGAPYLRKVGLKTYCNYKELSSALEKMFSGFTFGKWASKEKIDGMSECPLADQFLGYEYVLTYEDKDGDWMLVGDVPWDMFIDSCKRLRIMKGSDAIGLAPRAMEKNTNPK